MEKEAFQSFIWSFGKKHFRPMPWRHSANGYHILLSEVMLQQTQVPRVLVKYPEFLSRFPTVESLAHVPLRDVLSVWQGMGYNRRGMYLKQSAEQLVQQYGGIIPREPHLLERLPGIGPATARAIVVYTYNTPHVFIETNIRRIYIHHFFGDREGVHDKELVPLVEATLDRENPRDWYYALMDYGATLPKLVTNPNRKSKHYTKQSKFEGSTRQVRGSILRALVARDGLSHDALLQYTKTNPSRFVEVIGGMVKDGLVRETGGVYSIQE